MENNYLIEKILKILIYIHKMISVPLRLKLLLFNKLFHLFILDRNILKLIIILIIL